jgi:hypothetical protein
MSLLFVGFMRGYIERERRKDVGLYLHPQLAPKYREPPPYERERDQTKRERERWRWCGWVTNHAIS